MPFILRVPTTEYICAVKQGAVGGVDIEGDARGRRLVGVEKQGDEQVGEFLEVGGDLMVPAIAGVPGVLDVGRGSASTCHRVRVESGVPAIDATSPTGLPGRQGGAGGALWVAGQGHAVADPALVEDPGGVHRVVAELTA